MSHIIYFPICTYRNVLIYLVLIGNLHAIVITGAHQVSQRAASRNASLYIFHSTTDSCRLHFSSLINIYGKVLWNVRLDFRHRVTNSLTLYQFGHWQLEPRIHWLRILANWSELRSWWAHKSLYRHLCTFCHLLLRI